MAQIKKRHSANIEGDFFVDDSCIDCDACRGLAPEIYEREDDQSIVFHQPDNDKERYEALIGLIACPTSSIGTTEKAEDLQSAKESLPIKIHENVYFCGYNSKKSYGAASYFIQREAGNILIDSPRFSATFSRSLKELGGVRYHYLTHIDDVADHQKYHDLFQCDRILHKDDIASSTKDMEIQPDGLEPFPLDTDLMVIPVPGHTKGHTVLLYQNRYLFTGDHLAYSHHLEHLYGFRNHCWYSWDRQIKSMETLLDYSFEWVLPGHGRRYHCSSPEIMKKELGKCIRWMKTV